MLDLLDLFQLDNKANNKWSFSSCFLISQKEKSFKNILNRGLILLRHVQSYCYTKNSHLNRTEHALWDSDQIALLREDILFWVDNYITYWYCCVCAGMLACTVALISRTDVNGREMFFRRSRKTCGLFVLLYIQTFTFSAFVFKHWSGSFLFFFQINISYSGFQLIYSHFIVTWIVFEVKWWQGRQAKYFRHIEQWYIFVCFFFNLFKQGQRIAAVWTLSYIWLI